jgi:hypothetical protein
LGQIIIFNLGCLSSLGRVRLIYLSREAGSSGPSKLFLISHWGGASENPHQKLAKEGAEQ